MRADVAFAAIDMPRISVIIITHNEERNIARCLESCQGIADETVVVDSGSSDRTREIAGALGARVLERAWTNYSDQKNHANTFAAHDWILSLDADEALSDGLREELQRLKEEGFAGAYRFKRLTNYCGHWVRHGGWYPDAKVRLFPKAGTRWEGEHVHETLALPDGCRVIDLDHDLLHYSYHSVEDHRDRIERYSTLHARAMHAQGKRTGAIRMWLAPVVKFVQGYALQLGFLDGWAGWRIATLSAWAVHLKYRKLKEMQDHGAAA
ncbi:MAG: glycosyltransferase family 2 protein [Flavobacteriales bacterium]|nr:MAG: glycosyltransferase family 2 protein [Flavobacteriales bacterium]